VKKPLRNMSSSSFTGIGRSGGRSPTRPRLHCGRPSSALDDGGHYGPEEAEDEPGTTVQGERKVLPEKIAEQERFSAILQTASDGFWIVSDEGRIVFINDAYCRISGYTREELLSMNIVDLEARRARR